MVRVGIPSGKSYPEDDFIQVLKERLGIEAVSITIMKRSDSVFTVAGKNKQVPYLKIKVKQPYYEKIVCDHKPQGLVNEEYFEKIRTVWFEYSSGKYVDYKEYYDSKMYIGTSCFDDECFTRFARENKQIIEQYLLKTLGKAPAKIYASSMPGINIVYSTADFELLNLKDDQKRNKACDGIIGLARESVGKEYGPLTCRLDIRFYHPEMKEYNGYGLSRED